MVKYSIIIPTLNEEEGIAKVICGVPEGISRDAEIIVVDSSTDMTPHIAARLGANVIRPAAKGKGNALHAGVQASSGKIVIILDGDGTDPPQYIPKLLGRLNNYDIVFGTRNVASAGSRTYKGIYVLYDTFILPLFMHAGLKIKGDPLAGFRVMRRETWDKLGLKSEDFLIETEMNIRAIKLGLKIGEVPIPHLKRAGGLLKSKFFASPNQWVKIINYVLNETTIPKLKKYKNLDELGRRLLKI